ncbi:MAG: glycogen debranching N-terminal domain-containing protein [Bryobacteraceae bacterium]
MIEVEEQHYIAARSAHGDDRPRVLKQGDTFAVFDHYGDIQPIGLGEQGLYHEEMRFLNKWIFHLCGKRPLLLSSSLREDNVVLTVDFTNPDIHSNGHTAVPHGSLHVCRSKFLWNGICYERVEIHNYSLEPVEIPLTFRFGADFADIFEVRGEKRKQRGTLFPESFEDRRLILAYDGLDGVTRRARIECSPEPRDIVKGEMRFRLRLGPKENTTLSLTVVCEGSAAVGEILPYEWALAEASRNAHPESRERCLIETSNTQFNRWIHRSAADLQMMISPTPFGSYPYAGVPWFSTPFGRDGIITALEYLWVDPDLARGVLSFLAATQAEELSDEMDSEPGKILHETRKGEMAILGEVPFRRYYGSIDSTPLFIMLAAAYYARTGDLALLESIWPNVLAALEWIDNFGDRDGDGFVEYFRHSPNGLVQQGWKDSHNSVFHADGAMAEGPIALCEVQGYVYAAKRGLARIAGELGNHDLADELLRQSEILQERFDQAFWCEELGMYALALDGEKRQCRVRASNAGHCLYTGIAMGEHARTTAETLSGSEFFSGWGVRTVSNREVRYNPMSYHNGSIWPHDNAILAAGLARAGYPDAAASILTGLFEATTFFELHRLPELFCGFPRRAGSGPTEYPVACSPQAWAAGAVFLLLQACLGLEIDAPSRSLCFRRPVLPESLREMRIRNLRIGASAVDLTLIRYEHVVGIDMTRRDGALDISVFK